MTNVVVSSAELDRMRVDAEALALPSTCTVQRAGNTVDSVGSVTPGWSNVYTGVSCRLAPTGAGRGQPEQAEEWASISPWVLSAEWDADIQPGDQILLDSDTYQVVVVQDDHDFRILRRVFVVKVE